MIFYFNFELIFQGDLSSTNNGAPNLAPVVELPGNPSSFSVYAHVRNLVLENAARQAQCIYLSVTQPLPSDSESDVDSERGKDTTIQIPKVIIIKQFYISLYHFNFNCCNISLC